MKFSFDISYKENNIDDQIFKEFEKRLLEQFPNCKWYARDHDTIDGYITCVNNGYTIDNIEDLLTISRIISKNKYFFIDFITKTVQDINGHDTEYVRIFNSTYAYDRMNQHYKRKYKAIVKTLRGKEKLLHNILLKQLS